MIDGRARQAAVYLDGVTGRRPRVPVDRHALERAAERRMTREAFAYVAAGAGDGATMRANRAAFEKVEIVPRMLRGTAQRDLRVELFGRTWPAPMALAPIGVLEMAHRKAELAVAPAAAGLGIPMVFSNQASVEMERVAAALGDSPRWFQLYWSTSNELVASLVQRAERAGCEAIVVTLDTTLLGWRTRDLDLAYLPFLRGKGIQQYVTDPVFQEMMKTPPEPERQPRPTPSAVKTLLQMRRRLPKMDARAAVQTFIATYSRPGLAWDDLAFLRERTRLPILLKGIIHADDARTALDHGIDGLVVSNHGGRQVDGAIGTLDALPGVLAAVEGRIPVLLDSGIRGGSDVFKALALGATAVLLGRPYVYGLAAGGEAGVREVIENVLAELDLTMGLSGCRAVSEITAERLAGQE